MQEVNSLRNTIKDSRLLLRNLEEKPLERSITKRLKRAEDAFVYELNGIHEGYGFIERSINISNYKDILGHLVKQKNNYDTTRIVSTLAKTVREKDVLYV